MPLKVVIGLYAGQGTYLPLPEKLDLRQAERDIGFSCVGKGRKSGHPIPRVVAKMWRWGSFT